MNEPAYTRIVAHYTDCFARHGATAKGVDWPKDGDVATRYGVMLGVAAGHALPFSLLDLGCGYGALLDWMGERRADIEYRGIDLSAPMIDEAKKRHPGGVFEVRDILTAPLADNSVDFVVMNGVMTEKLTLSQSDMEAFAKQLIKSAFASAKYGIAFNVMSAQVDWKREDLFHWGFDELAAFLNAEVSRHYSFRADYGLYEYTAYVYKQPRGAGV
jgi:SAM-dependent methyltransferase